MPIVVNKAREEVQPPTQGQFVEILQSVAESHLPSKKNYDDAAFVAARTAQTFPTADDRAHKTGNDANQASKSGNLITDTFLSWTITGDIVQGSSGNAQGLEFQGTSGDNVNPVQTQGAQALSAGFVAGDFVELRFKFRHVSGELLTIVLKDDDGRHKIDGLVGGLPGTAAEGENDIYLAGVANRDTVANLELILRDKVGNMVGEAYDITITKTPSVTP